MAALLRHRATLPPTGDACFILEILRPLMRRRRLLVVFALAACTRATGAPPTLAPPPPGDARVTILHFNDVYEITPVEGGRSGGLARVATVRKQLLQRGIPLLTTLGGDFLSPSALGTAR